MAFIPAVTLEWAPTNTPFDETPTWVDITTRLLEWEWTYGRDDESGEYETGQGWVLLDNRDRAFDPTYTSGTWYPNVKPRKKFRMRCTWNAVTYPVFIAHSRGYPLSYLDGIESVGQVRIDLADALALLKAVDLDAIGFNRPQELSSDRLDAILDTADIPDAERNILEGSVVVDEAEGGDSALEEARTTAATETQPIWVDRSGLVGYA